MLESIDHTKKLPKDRYKEVMAAYAGQLYSVQMASREAGLPVIILFEGWEAVGKGRVIRSLTGALDPFTYSLFPIGPALSGEKRYPWLWRFWSKIPKYGEWGIFDTSWYRRVMVDRMEGQILEHNWRRAYRDIVDFERTLVDDGYQIIKFFLHTSKQSQRRRLDKISNGLVSTRTVTTGERDQNRRYDDWIKAYEEVFDRTETVWAPWTIVEADHGRYARAKVCKTVIDTLSRCMNFTMETIDIDRPPEQLLIEDADKLDGQTLEPGPGGSSVDAGITPADENSGVEESKPLPTDHDSPEISDHPQETGQE